MQTASADFVARGGELGFSTNGPEPSPTVPEPSPTVPPGSSRASARVIPNGISFNSCEGSGRTIPVSALQPNPLSSETLDTVPEIHDALCDPVPAKFLQYIVECALPAGVEISTNVDGMTLRFAGHMGLAPEWHDAPCDLECQEWVSSCIFARMNMFAVTVMISMRGDGKAALASDDEEQRLLPVQEAAFFGNIFSFPSVGYACRGRGQDAFYRVVRRCAEPGSPCVFIRALGTCDLFDGATGAPTTQRLCESESAQGGFQDCHVRASDPSTGEFPFGRVYHHPITVFTQQSTMRLPDGC